MIVKPYARNTQPTQSDVALPVVRVWHCRYHAMPTHRGSTSSAPPCSCSCSPMPSSAVCASRRVTVLQGATMKPAAVPPRHAVTAHATQSNPPYITSSSPACSATTAAPASSVPSAVCLVPRASMPTSPVAASPSPAPPQGRHYPCHRSPRVRGNEVRI